MNNRMERACYNILVNSSSLQKEQLDRLYEESESSAETFSQMVVNSGLLKEAEMLQLYAKNLGIPYVHLKSIPIDSHAVERVPVKIAWYYKLFPVHFEDGKLIIAVSQLLDVHTIDEIRLSIGGDIGIAFAASSDIEEMLKRHYGLGASTVDQILSQSGDTSAVPVDDLKISEVEDIEKLAETASVGKLVNQIILDAVQKRATDIHIEPYEGNVRLRYRIDGVLQEAKVSPEMRRFFLPILSRIKIMANLNIVERRLPQDGKARVKTREQSLDLRISSIPTPHGESMVIRLLPSKMIFDLRELGLHEQQFETFNRLIERPNGIIFVTGPTGSGKSTTLYAALQKLNIIKRKIITIEDPVEYELGGVTQIQVMPEVGLTFACGLRSVLRHDPDVMMVGEVRDFETADTAIRVALTGHLVLSTLHTNDAASGITRLLDIGLEPYLIASSVIAITAQRLIRTICSSCRISNTDLPEEYQELIRGELNLEGNERIALFTGAGCEDCGGTGYSGRVAIHEILLIDEVIRKMIFNRASAQDVLKVAVQNGMMTLRQAGWHKVLQGVTTVEEVLNVVPAKEEDERKGDETAGDSIGPTMVMSGQSKDEETSQVPERRQFIRIPLKAKLAFRRIKDEDVQRKDLPSLIDGVIQNLSQGGMLFVTPYKLKKNDVLEVEFQLPHSDDVIKCLAMINRVDEGATPGGDLNVAVSFLVIGTEERMMIEHLIQEDGENQK